MFFLPLLAACKERPISTAEILCSDKNILIDVYNDRIEAIIDDKIVKMPQTVSASGARYKSMEDGEGLVLWNKGKYWMMISDEGSDKEIMFDCVNK